MNLKKNIIPLFVITLVIFIYKPWLIQEQIIGSDFPFLHQEMIDEIAFPPPSWSVFHGNGLGGKILLYSLDSYMYFTQTVSRIFDLSWIIVYKFFWFGLFVITSFYSSYKLSKHFFKNSQSANHLSALIYTTNTYILMVVGGGQMGFALSYSLLPLVLLKFIEMFDDEYISVNMLITYSILLGILLIFDLRVFYIYTLISIIYFFITNLIWKGADLKKKTLYILSGNLLALALNSYWIIPLALSPVNTTEVLGANYSAVTSFVFFSFATLSNAISLLHPNWPENIFGKIQFQNPVYLILPLIAFSSILIRSKTNFITVFSVIAAIGIFLAKGANEPFGVINILLFENLPGFQMFRDPTKWYVLVTLSYSIMMPASIIAISNTGFLHNRLGKNSSIFCMIVFLVIWIFLSKESFTNQLKGTFSKQKVPKEYLDFKKKLLNENSFSRTLWIPRQYKFTYTDTNHPAIEADQLFKATSSAQLINSLNEFGAEKRLKRLGIKYLVIPYDSMETIFVSDGKYNDDLRSLFEKELDELNYLTKSRIGNLIIYNTNFDTNLFSINGEGIPYEYKKPYFYQIDGSHLKKGNLIFSQNYHRNWRLKSSTRTYLPSRTVDNLMEFNVPITDQSVKIEFIEQKNYNIGWNISGVVLVLLVTYLLYPSVRNKF